MRITSLTNRTTKRNLTAGDQGEEFVLNLRREKGFLLPFVPFLRILTYFFFFAPEIYLSRFGTRAITLEYLDSHKSSVTRTGYER